MVSSSRVAVSINSDNPYETLGTARARERGQQVSVAIIFHKAVRTTTCTEETGELQEDVWERGRSYNCLHLLMPFFPLGVMYISPH